MAIAPRFMLDTNIASHIIKGPGAALRARLRATPLTDTCVSAITEGELLFGLARKPEATALGEAVASFLKHVEVLPWDSAAAAAYGPLRARLEAARTPLGNLDTLIAAHALAAGCVLVTNDRAFGRATDLTAEDWMQE